MGIMQEQMASARTMPEALEANNRKIESKDSMWKPAPIMGREIMGGSGPSLSGNLAMQRQHQ